MRDWGEGVLRPWANIAQDAAEGTLTKETLAAEAFSSGSKAVRVATAGALMIGAGNAAIDFLDFTKWGSSGNPFQEHNRDPNDRLIEVLDRTGLLGHIAGIKHANDAARFNQDPMYAWLGPAPTMGGRLVISAFKEEENSFRDQTAREVANLTRLPLPAEVLWSLSMPSGTENWRKNFRQWMTSPEIAPENFDPMEDIIPDEIKPFASTWAPTNFVRDWYQDFFDTAGMTFDEIFNSEGEVNVEQGGDTGEVPEERLERLRTDLLKMYDDGRLNINQEAIEDGDTRETN
jgi:hypothetical protein